MYNLISFSLNENKYKLRLSAKDGAGYSEFRDEKGKMYEVEFNEKPSALELGMKIMEMFEFKEKYDGDFEQDVLFNLNITITVVKTGEWTKNLKTGEQTAKSMIEQLYAVKNLLERLFMKDWQDIKVAYILVKWIKNKCLFQNYGKVEKY